MNRRRVYLDHNATTPLRPEVLQAMLPYLQENYGNPFSLHAAGAAALSAVEGARQEVATALGAHPDEVVFVSGGTEADNLAVKGAVGAKRGRPKPHVVTTAVEHEAVLGACQALERQGCAATYVGVDAHGRVDPAAVEAALRPQTVLVSIMHANNEVGTLQPLEEVARRARAKGVRVHTDAVQTFGKLPLQVDQLGVDYLSLSAHKVGGPKGVGALYVRRGCPLEPQVHGGLQERGLRAGTHDVPGIVGLGEAARLAQRDMVRDGTRVAVLAERLLVGLRAALPGLVLVGHPTERLPGTLCVAVPGLNARAVVLAMNIEGIAVSQGAACSTGERRVSHVLVAMRAPAEVAAGAVRLSLGRATDEADVDYVLARLPAVLSAAKTYGDAIYEGRRDDRPPDCYSRVV